MLILSRKLGESIVIDGHIRVQIMRVDGDVVKIGIEAPVSVPVHRQEVYEEIQRNNQQALMRQSAPLPKFAGAAAKFDANGSWIDECAADLLANRGSCLVVAGSHLPDAVHAVAYTINQFLGNVGSTVDFVYSVKRATIG